MALAITAFVATFVLLGSAGLLLLRFNTADRLGEVVAPRSGRLPLLSRIGNGSARGSLDAMLTPFEKVLPRSEQESSSLQKRLTRAGYRERRYVDWYYGSRVAVPLALCAAAFITGAWSYMGAFTFVLCAAVGYLLPEFWLANRISNRQLNIRLGLPEALDLMVICTEAGLGLDQCLLRVARELARSQPEISEELTLVHLAQKAGSPRADALKSLADRTDVDSVRALVQTLIQSDTFGTSIGKNLRVYSDTLRTQRRQKVEENAAKTTVKLIFPLALFIFPTLFIVVLGPAAIVFMDGIRQFMESMPSK